MLPLPSVPRLEDAEARHEREVHHRPVAEQESAFATGLAGTIVRLGRRSIASSKLMLISESVLHPFESTTDLNRFQTRSDIFVFHLDRTSSHIHRITSLFVLLTFAGFLSVA